MGDINQEWKELRMKNGNFINHLDGELAKIEKEKKLLDEQKEQIFYDPVTCMYFKADAEGIQKLLDKQSECVAKMTADYSALVEENMEIQKQLNGAKAQCENTVANRWRISELSQEVIDLKEEKIDLQKQLYAAKKETDDFISMYDKAAAEAHQAKVAKDRMGYSNRCMQSKIAKQSNEIKRLTEENERLRHDNKALDGALDIAAKDADANFERGKIKGMEGIWQELKDCYDGHPFCENEKIFGYYTVGDMLLNLSPTWFINKAEEYHKQKEKEAREIKIGDEVEVTDKFDPDLDDFGIVIAVYPERRSFEVIGPKFEGCFDEMDIQDGSVKKTGRHFDSIPLDYLA